MFILNASKLLQDVNITMNTKYTPFVDTLKYSFVKHPDTLNIYQHVMSSLHFVQTTNFQCNQPRVIYLNNPAIVINPARSHQSGLLDFVMEGFSVWRHLGQIFINLVWVKCMRCSFLRLRYAIFRRVLTPCISLTCHQSQHCHSGTDLE